MSLAALSRRVRGDGPWLRSRASSMHHSEWVHRQKGLPFGVRLPPSLQVLVFLWWLLLRRHPKESRVQFISKEPPCVKGLTAALVWDLPGLALTAPRPRKQHRLQYSGVLGRPGFRILLVPLSHTQTQTGKAPCLQFSTWRTGRPGEWSVTCSQAGAQPAFLHSQEYSNCNVG